MAQVIRITKSGFNVLTETTPKNFIFNSDYNHLKTAGSGTFTKALSSYTKSTQTVAHGLGIRPLCLGYWRDNSTNDWFICSSQHIVGILGIFNDYNVSIKVDTTNITFDCFHNNSSGPASVTLEVHYEFFYEGL